MVAPLASLLLPEAPTEQAMLEGALDTLAGAFDTAGAAAPHALLVVTEDAGSATAVQFWRQALSSGVALASPAAFPWCLANAPAALLARRFGLQGPNLSWLVDDCGQPAAYQGAAAWLAGEQEGAGMTWLAALRFAPPARIALWRWPAQGGAVHDADAQAHALARAWRAASNH